MFSDPHTSCDIAEVWRDRRPVTVVYVNDPMPTAGPAALREQTRAVEACIVAAGLQVDRFVIESGGRLTAKRRGQRLQEIINLAEAGAAGGTLIIANLQHLAKEPHNVLEAAADALEAGLSLRDPTGILHPSPETIAIFRAAARGALWTSRADPAPRRHRSPKRAAPEAQLDGDHRA